ncbi:hypothetical protein BDQ94DRAFT_118243 [Aspergillus welwitschiae]|uniref:Uncharacterized protein n=1 Tax=Aspergillus welwitschiae TaxID=1341132 RepID=A0A3F3PK29_9EURO|nr:hypothetical protein BDQ94DRAFT_118243 [Aspergillus welwitschiae]RDH27300.1 hypothetical protein BDQ94DRAFT_118243 [Aspergillus welwitschiae]
MCDPSPRSVSVERTITRTRLNAEYIIGQANGLTRHTRTPSFLARSVPGELPRTRGVIHPLRHCSGTGILNMGSIVTVNTLYHKQLSEVLYMTSSGHGLDVRSALVMYDVAPMLVRTAVWREQTLASLRHDEWIYSGKY